MGTDVFIGVFRYLLKTNEIAALYTYHNDEDYFSEYNIVKLAKKNNIPVFYDRPTPEEMSSFIENGVELFITAEYAYKIPIPETDRFRGLNIHSSYLPDGRSYYPIEIVMDRGMSYAGITIHKLAPQVDTGDIIAQQKIYVTPGDDSVDIYLYSAAYAEGMIKNIFADFEKAWGTGIKQTEVTEFWRRPAQDRLLVTHSMTVKEAATVFRNFNRMTEVEINGGICYVISLMPGHADIGAAEFEVDKDNYLFGLSDGHIRIEVKQKENKQNM